MHNIGVSVGEWTENKYANFGGINNRLFLGGIDGFLPKFSTGSLYGTTWQGLDLSDRRESAKILIDIGFTTNDISRFWKKYQIDEGAYTKDKFVAYAKRERLIEKERKKQDDALYEKAKEEEDKEIISDLNLFPSEPNNSPIPKELMGDKPKETEKTNYLVYGLIGLGVIVGAFLIFKKK